uniref:Uncharacterized protein n=1 Tax=Anguilla anguilla TaxID=7936 RepID=A0A0E9Y2N9_ANGAN
MDRRQCRFFIRQWANLPNLRGTLDHGGNADNSGLKEPFIFLKSSSRD